MSPAKHSFARLPRKCDYRTDTQTDKVIPMCRYASQGTQKRLCITYKIIYLLLSVGPVCCWFCLSVQYVAVCLSVRPSVILPSSGVWRSTTLFCLSVQYVAVCLSDCLSVILPSSGVWRSTTLFCLSVQYVAGFTQSYPAHNGRNKLYKKERILCSGFLYSLNLQQNERTHEKI